MLWSTLDLQCPVPWARSEQGDAIPGFGGDKELGAGILHGRTFHGQAAPGSKPAAPAECQRGTTILPAPSQAQEFWRGKRKAQKYPAMAQKYPGMAQKDPCTPPDLRV